MLRPSAPPISLALLHRRLRATSHAPALRWHLADRRRSRSATGVIDRADVPVTRRFASSATRLASDRTSATSCWRARHLIVEAAAVTPERRIDGPLRSISSRPASARSALARDLDVIRAHAPIRICVQLVHVGRQGVEPRGVASDLPADRAARPAFGQLARGRALGASACARRRAACTALDAGGADDGSRRFRRAGGAARHARRPRLDDLDDPRRARLPAARQLARRRSAQPADIGDVRRRALGNRMGIQH